MNNKLARIDELSSQENLSMDELEDTKPKVKYKVSNVPDELPIGFYDVESKRWFRGFEVGKMSSEILSSFDKDVNPFRLFGTIVGRGINRIYDLETGEDLPNWRGRSSKLFFPDTFFLLTEILIKTKGTSLVPTVYKCKQCSKFTKFENPVGESGGLDSEKGFDLLTSSEELSSLEMEDIRSLPFNKVRDLEVPELYFHFDEGVVIEGERYTEYVFRIPEIGDYISHSSGTANKAGEKKVLFYCLVSVNGMKGSELSILKSRFGMALLGFDIVEYMKILNKINSMGYDYTNHTVACAHCGYTFKDTFDLTNFFGSLLGR